MAQKEVVRSMEARTGRTKQRYGPEGQRLVAGVVALSKDKRKVLVVESTNRKNHWVLPKGGYETDEPTPEEAAAREAWEEAGITGRVTRSLGEIHDPRPRHILEASKTDKSIPHPALYLFFEFSVDKEEAEWPEMHKRQRKWLSYDEAKKCFEIMGRAELREALERSGVIR